MVTPGPETVAQVVDRTGSTSTRSSDGVQQVSEERQQLRRQVQGSISDKNYLNTFKRQFFDELNNKYENARTRNKKPGYFGNEATNFAELFKHAAGRNAKGWRDTGKRTAKMLLAEVPAAQQAYVKQLLAFAKTASEADCTLASDAFIKVLAASRYQQNAEELAAARQQKNDFAREQDKPACKISAADRKGIALLGARSVRLDRARKQHGAATEKCKALEQQFNGLPSIFRTAVGVK